MKNKDLNGILWLVIAILLIGLLISRIGSSPVVHIGSGKDVVFGDSDKLIEAEDEVTYRYSLSNIKKIDIDCVSEKLIITEGRGDDVLVSVDYEGAYWTTMLVGVDGSSLKIHPKEKRHTGITKGSCTVTVQVPESRSGNNLRYDIQNVSGSITMNNQSGSTIDISNVSGSCHVEGCQADTIEISGVSGSLHVTDIEGRLKMNTVSGSIHGDFGKSLAYGLSAESVSGSVHLAFTRDSSFEAEFETVSGSIRTDFKKYGGKKEGTIVNGTGDNSISLKTISGSISVNQL